MHAQLQAVEVRLAVDQDQQLAIEHELRRLQLGEARDDFREIGSAAYPVWTGYRPLCRPGMPGTDSRPISARSARPRPSAGPRRLGFHGLDGFG
jgi:hypothetical protein